MTAGGLIAGFVIALVRRCVARATELKEDARSRRSFSFRSRSAVTIVSLKGNNVDLLHFLFGSVLALDDPTLLLIAAITTLSLAVLAVIYRPAGAGMRRPRLPALGQPRLARPPHRVPGRWW
jgi:zinc/manganese transport system permease protein